MSLDSTRVLIHESQSYSTSSSSLNNPIPTSSNSSFSMAMNSNNILKGINGRNQGIINQQVNCLGDGLCPLCELLIPEWNATPFCIMIPPY